jgi:hypothetical protein
MKTTLTSVQSLLTQAFNKFTLQTTLYIHNSSDNSINSRQLYTYIIQLNNTNQKEILEEFYITCEFIKQ